MGEEVRTLVDVDSGLARVRGNKRLYKRMLGLFLKSEEFKAFEEAVAAGDFEKAGDSAHTIKGMSGNLSLTAVFEDSAGLMTNFRQGRTDDALLERYRGALQDTLAEIDELLPKLE